MPELVGYKNGEWPPMNQILPDPNDRGTLLGDQVLDVERTFGGTRGSGWKSMSSGSTSRSSTCASTSSLPPRTCSP